jgi:hypothetical protein
MASPVKRHIFHDTINANLLIIQIFCHCILFCIKYISHGFNVLWAKKTYKFHILGNHNGKLNVRDNFKDCLTFHQVRVSVKWVIFSCHFFLQ